MTSSRSIRPTDDVSVAVLDSLDDMVGQLFERLDGISNEEYLWEPVDGMWSVRPAASGEPRVDGAGVDREIDPAPMTTIAWRLWHLSVDCLDDYRGRFEGNDADADPRWFLTAEEAVDTVQASWDRYRAVVAGRPDWWAELGEAWGPWSRHSLVDMVLHASNELVHHSAEIALLRDLYANQSNP